jgi:hypothetical protein
MRVRVLVCGLMLGALAGPAAAQEAGDIGVTMGYPGAAGVVWHLTNRFALRPDVSLATSTSESVATGTGLLGGVALSSTNSSHGWGATVGLSGLVTVRTIDRLRLYLVPRVAYSHSTSDNKTGLAGSLAEFTATTKGIIASGSFGTQYSLHDRFAIFGELGLQYSALTTTSDFPGSKNETELTSLGLRSAVGMTFYF